MLRSLRAPTLKGLLPLVAVAAFGFVGCSADAEISVGNDTVNDTSLEESLSDQLGERVGEPPEEVDCPAGVTAKEGEKFECVGTAPNGDEFVIDVTLLDDEGGYRFFVPPNAEPSE